ncbi:MAG: hypothetical protein GY696_31595 [Gammaproteobacteria bacterium]|nr:hypothetical protein [Gammaproteobacteria bacterium]
MTRFGSRIEPITSPNARRLRYAKHFSKRKKNPGDLRGGNRVPSLSTGGGIKGQLLILQAVAQILASLVQESSGLAAQLVANGVVAVQVADSLLAAVETVISNLVHLNLSIFK